MAQASGIVFDIQRSAIHDGPGVRTTVFLKGCPLGCRWCHNPESQAAAPEVAYYESFCVRCGACAKACPNHAHMVTADGHTFDRGLCTVQGACVTACAFDALRLTGREMSVQEVMGVVLRDRAYYESSGGGLTVSGGEPMMQFAFLHDLLSQASAASIHTALDTCGHAPLESFKAVRPLVDCFLLDYKLTDPQRHRQWTGVTNELILSNLQWLYASGATIMLRCPIIPGANDTPDHWRGIAQLSARYPRLAGIELMAFHDIGYHKYERYGHTNPMPDLAAPDEAAKQSWLQALRAAGCSRATIG